MTLYDQYGYEVNSAPTSPMVDVHLEDRFIQQLRERLITTDFPGRTLLDQFARPLSPVSVGRILKWKRIENSAL